MLTREFSADATPCQRRVALQRVAAGVLLPTWATWATGAQAQMGLSGAINYAGWFRALSQRMAKAYCQQYLQVLPAAAVDVMGLARKMVQTGSGELARGMQSGQWPAEVGRQLAEVQKQFALLNQMTSAPATTTALVAAASEQADRTLLIAQAVTEAPDDQPFATLPAMTPQEAQAIRARVLRQGGAAGLDALLKALGFPFKEN